MEYILENEKVIEEGDGDGGWVDTHHNVDVNTGEPLVKTDDAEINVILFSSNISIYIVFWISLNHTFKIFNFLLSFVISMSMEMYTF